jgi:molecular chaperone DnaJ
MNNMAKQDYYEVLGVQRNSSDAEIKTAYRKAALDYHPDRNQEPGAEVKFKDAAEAYDVLSDTDKRAQYDRFGHNSPQQTHWSQHDPFDIFNSFFGGFGRQRQKGADLHARIRLTLEEVATGVEKNFSVKQTDRCSKCHGKGGTGPPCLGCAGYGQVRRQDGPFVVSVGDCPRCQGSGIKIEQSCNKCSRKGHVENNKTISIKIPKGVDDGQVMRIQREGHLSVPSAPRGDLYCHIEIAPHSVFERRGPDLYMHKTISFADAVGGISIDVPTIAGEEVSLKVPPGTQFGQMLRLHEKGIEGAIQVTRGSPVKVRKNGDQFVQIRIAVPQNVSDEAIKILRQFEDTVAGKNHVCFV